MTGRDGFDLVLADARRLADPLQRSILRVLTERGHYDETADSFDWAAMESSDAAELLRTLPTEPFHELMALFVDTGLHDPEDPDGAACLVDDVNAILAAAPSSSAASTRTPTP